MLSMQHVNFSQGQIIICLQNPIRCSRLGIQESLPPKKQLFFYKEQKLHLRRGNQKRKRPLGIQYRKVDYL